MAATESTRASAPRCIACSSCPERASARSCFKPGWLCTNGSNHERVTWLISSCVCQYASLT